MPRLFQMMTRRTGDFDLIAARTALRTYGRETVHEMLSGEHPDIILFRM